MHIFITGATGFIGRRVVRELIGAGHHVLGLARSEAGATALTALGADVYRGALDDLENLCRGVAAADGVIHLAFNHDAFTDGGMSKFKANCETDRRVIEAIGSVLIGSGRPLLVTSGTGLANTVPGQPARENNSILSSAVIPRAASEEAAAAVAAQGVNVSVVRLPQVHDTVKQGLVTYAITMAREKGVSAYVGDGLNRWPATHVSDTARLYLLALEKHAAGSKYHAVAEEGVPLRDIAEVIGRGLRVPVVSLSQEEATAHFGVLAMFVGSDALASSVQTQEQLNWHPTGPGLLADLEAMNYSPS